MHASHLAYIPQDHQHSWSLGDASARFDFCTFHSAFTRNAQDGQGRFVHNIHCTSKRKRLPTFFSFVNQILRTFFYFLCLDGGRWMIGWDKKRGWLLGVGLGDGGFNF